MNKTLKCLGKKDGKSGCRKCCKTKKKCISACMNYNQNKTNNKYKKFIGKVVLVYLPNNQRPRYRWIVRERNDGRLIVRAPKIGVLIRDLDKKNDKDFNKEQLLPLNSEIRKN